MKNLFKRFLERGLNWLANGRLDELATLKVRINTLKTALSEAQTNENHIRSQYKSLFRTLLPPTENILK